MRWLQFKKIVILKCCLLLFYTTTTNHLLIGLWHIWQPAMVKFVPKKWVMVTGGLLLVWSSTAFWILAKPLHLRRMLSQLMRWTKNWNTCSQRQKGSSSSPQQCPTACAQPTLQRLKYWAMKFCFICHILLTSHQLTTMSSSISTTFCRENAFTTSKRQKMLSRVL